MYYSCVRKKYYSRGRLKYNKKKFVIFLIVILKYKKFIKLNEQTNVNLNCKRYTRIIIITTLIILLIEFPSHSDKCEVIS